MFDRVFLFLKQNEKKKKKKGKKKQYTKNEGLRVFR